MAPEDKSTTYEALNRVPDQRHGAAYETGLEMSGLHHQDMRNSGTLELLARLGQPGRGQLDAISQAGAAHPRPPGLKE